ncbi:MAG: prolyl oligopeptidase family serine peptidase, partial [Isosphaeraceae bacterium]
ERPDFIVENLLFQSRPGLYVTGNLYRPKGDAKTPRPAILYVCGHAAVKKDGVIYGSKAHYQHHAAWYAANGYVCLVVDTLQLGELPGIHHGTYREGMWWWQSRGYTSAGIEAWNGVRAIDYLISRPDVDPKRIGVTGRSGGGAASWWIGALDDRVAAVVPVAGITDLQNYVVDGKVEGHCDCMFMVNTYSWDFPLVAALIAPRPMLVENTDHDPIFPEDGVRRIYAQLEKVYKWYGASDRLGLVIGKGGHVDSVEIRHPSFAFFNKWFKDDASPIEEPDRSVPIEVLKVLKPGEVPPGNKNDVIQETFVAKAETPPVPTSKAEWETLRSRWMDELKTKVFAGWPDQADTVPLNVTPAEDRTRDGVRMRGYDFTSQEGIRLRFWAFNMEGDDQPKQIRVDVVDEEGWRQNSSVIVGAFTGDEGDEQTPKLVAAFGLGAITYFEYAAAGAGKGDWKSLILAEGDLVVVVAPRGVGPTAWDPKKETHIRRRFALLGQTLDGMRVWDVRRALAALRSIDALQGEATELLGGKGRSAPLALWAAVFEPEVDRVRLEDPPTSLREGPIFLNLDRVLGMPQALALLYPRKVELYATNREPWQWAADLAKSLGGNTAWPDISTPSPKAPAQP